MKEKKRINNFVYGTQYYRAPTPLPEEWEHDLKNMDKAGLDTLQVRVQWRWNEPAEGDYRFDDIDRLFELSSKYKKKMIFKFLMECAPDYIFHKYHGHRKDMNGRPLNPGANGAYYVGGWIPCFDNPDVIAKAIEFTRVFVERYRSRENLILWNVWNEPLSRPIGECGCGHSIEAYRKWLEKEYESVERLNNKFGKRWESFKTVMPPSMPGDYSELFIWRLWALDAVKSRLDFMYRTVRELDKTRPVISHVGGCSVIQDVASGSSDDIRNAGSVDFYGTSLPTAHHFGDFMEESFPNMICDWMRSVSEYYWVYELYPDWGKWERPISLADFKFKVWSSIAAGARGLLLWQYRAERVGHESNCAGLVNIDGSFKEITYESKKIKRMIEELEPLLLKARVETDDVGILYNLESDLINRIENTKGLDFWSFDLEGGYPYLYKRALFGIYALFREMGISPEWVEERNLGDRLEGLKLLYIPECFMISDELKEMIEKFTEGGGVVIAEEGIGMRGENTWVQPVWPGGGLAETFGARITGRVSAGKDDSSLRLFGRSLPAGGYLSYLRAFDAEVLGKFSDGSPCATRRVNKVLLGTSLGASFYENFKCKADDYIHVLGSLIESMGLSLPARNEEGVYTRCLAAGAKKILFVFNRSKVSRRVAPGENIKILREVKGENNRNSMHGQRTLEISPGEVRIYLCEERNLCKSKKPGGNFSSGV